MDTLSLLCSLFVMDANFDLNVHQLMQSLTDKSMQLVAESYPDLESLNITRCVKITDDGLLQVLQKCFSLQTLNLYALSG
jgi:hypothetical protein